MSTARAAVIVAVVALAAAAAVALASRTPASIRSAQPGSGATDPALGATFSEEQIARHGRYRAPAYLGFALTLVVEVVSLVILMRGPGARLVERIEALRGGLPVHALLLGIGVAVVLALALLPLGYVRGFVIPDAWGLSTQDTLGWLSDQARGLLIGAVIAGVSAVAFFGVVRWQPRWWWLIGWGTFTILTAVMVFLYPVAIAPLFNTFTPLDDSQLRTRLLSLADEAGVQVDEVLVADASRRTTTENAYVAGIGATKRLVLYDTLLASGDDDDTAFVVAHELGHRKENHVVKNIALAAAGLLVSFLVLLWLSRRAELWAWAGASGISDLRALPVLVLFATLAGLVTLPAESALSRAFERQADAVAIRLTNDPDTAVRTFRRLAFANLADLRPPRVAVWTLFSHPPIPERIRAAVAEDGASP